MHDGIKDIYGDLEHLNEATKSTKDSMAQLSAGATETADAVQKQTQQKKKSRTKWLLLPRRQEALLTV